MAMNLPKQHKYLYHFLQVEFRHYHLNLHNHSHHHRLLHLLRLQFELTTLFHFEYQ